MSSVSPHSYDVFVSHASEDKVAFVEPLVEALKNAGLRVWYDRFALKVGDSLAASIDAGLRESRFGVVVLSAAFFGKRWPRRELDGLTALEDADGRKRILPIWHDVSQADVALYSPMLAGLVAAQSTEGIQKIVRQLIQVVAGREPVEAIYDAFHDSVEVDVVALARANEMRISGHFFKDCHLRGPAVFILMSQVSFVDISFDFAQAVPIDENRRYLGFIALENSRLENCTFNNIGFAATARALAPLYYLPRPPADQADG